MQQIMNGLTKIQSSYVLNKIRWANLDFFINLKVESQDQFEDWNEELKNNKLM